MARNIRKVAKVNASSHPARSKLLNGASAADRISPQRNHGPGHNRVDDDAADPFDDADDEFHHELEAQGEALEAVVSEDEVDSIDDPVRMYLMQMGQIPLLNRAEEISSAQRIERTRTRFRHSMLATDYVLQGALDTLERVSVSSCVRLEMMPAASSGGET